MRSEYIIYVKRIKNIRSGNEKYEKSIWLFDKIINICTETCVYILEKKISVHAIGNLLYIDFILHDFLKSFINHNKTRGAPF